MTLESNIKEAIIKYLDQLRDDLASLDIEEGISNEEHEILVRGAESIAEHLAPIAYLLLDARIYKHRSL